MTATRFYVTTAIPYVNAQPHLGFALELVQADVLARHRRQRGDAVRFLTGTDDNSLKNVQAAEIEGVPVRELVDRNATAFAALREPLELSFDDFIRTSSDPRHRAGVERLWRACAAPATCTASTTKGCTASAASSSTLPTSCATAAVPSTTSSRSWSRRRTGSSACRATSGGCVT